MTHRRSDAGHSLSWMPVCVCLAVLWCGAVARAEYGESRPAIPPAVGTVLKVARSEDGRSFTQSGKVFVSRAAAPALATLRDGTIVALFDYAGQSASNTTGDSITSTVLAASVSKNGGGSWSAARSIRFAGRGSRGITARHATLVRASDRYLRLYFVAEVNGRNSHPASSKILSAVSLRGLDYRLDPQTRVRAGGFIDPHPVAAMLDGKMHLYIAGYQARGSADSARVEHFISRKGRRFARLRPSHTPEIDVVGSVVPVEGGFRAYVSTGDGITSLLSRDGRDWDAEDGLIMSAAWDPAVVRLGNGSYLMIYCAPADRESLASSQLVEVSIEQLGEEIEPLDLDDAAEGSEEQAASAEWDDQSEFDVDFGDGDSTEESMVAAPGEDVAGADAVAGISNELVDATSGADAEGGADIADRLAEMDSAEQAEFLQELLEPVEAERIVGADEAGFALRPDFKNQVDYLEWYRQYALSHPEDNAFDYYDAFFPDPSDEAESDPSWPEFDDMFNSDYEGPIEPWDPADHPDWEEAYDRTAEVREKFAEAATHAGYAPSTRFNWEDAESLPDSDELLLGMLLPSLAPHRTMNKATLAAAWRKKDGKVPPEQMLDAWRTTYRAAAHMFEGATLIENLVGTAEAAKVQQSARLALKHGIFSGDDLQAAFDTLREYDRDHWDPSVALRGEHGMMMQMTQWMFTPAAADGRPQLNKERADAMANLDWLEGEGGRSLTKMGPDDAYATVEAVDGHYSELTAQMQIGYPDVRAADINATTEKYLPSSPLTQQMFPSLGRVYTLSTRLKTSRRATQLAYATHLFKEKNGRWPASLDELPQEWGRTMRIDPFTGNNFGYRVTEDGPRIYSLSENGVDDGGVHSPRWEDKVDPETGSDDHVFWPPQEPY